MNYLGTESVLETMLRSDPLDQTSTVECDATISSSCKGAHSGNPYYISPSWLKL